MHGKGAAARYLALGRGIFEFQRRKSLVARAPPFFESSPTLLPATGIGAQGGETRSRRGAVRGFNIDNVLKCWRFRISAMSFFWGLVFSALRLFFEPVA